jgi:hypothetical protein
MVEKKLFCVNSDKAGQRTEAQASDLTGLLSLRFASITFVQELNELCFFRRRLGWLRKYFTLRPI